ncbi:NADPH-dependent aldo-keto reductase, similarity to GRE3, stress-induced in yeast [hydrothermal vent metagenome]|uniref:NADPH-dependent aldo-keto reductase, similarity to GRE3, stress-induced in yeast n=1 Tax=hydrothermal vent metagenome TaxID=652676 RepID=A0A3B1DRE9_9ZZZZ
MESVKIKSGRAIPAIGLGLWKVQNEMAADVVVQAIDAGYRHFDSACDYGNESEVGDGFQKAFAENLCVREDMWVTSKLWNTYHKAEHVRAACEKTLHDLKLDYLDLYLVHFPISLRYVPFEERYPPEWFFDPDAANPTMELSPVPISETWQAMEELVQLGLVKEIGVSNFNCSLIRDLLSHANIPPAVLQIESHPYLTQEKLIRYCKESEIAVTAFSPLGALSYFQLGMADPSESILETPTVKEIAASHQRSAAQILLRWGVQRGTAVVSKTTNLSRMKENLSLFDFQLTDDEMQRINQLNINRRFNDPGEFCEAAFNKFMPIYE